MFSRCAEENKFYEISWNELIDSLKDDTIYSYLAKNGYSQQGKSKESFLIFGSPEKKNVEVDLETVEEATGGENSDMGGVSEIHTYEFVRNLEGVEEAEYCYLMIQYDSYLTDEVDVLEEEEESPFEPDLFLLNGKLYNTKNMDAYEELASYMTNVKIFVMKNHGENQGKSVINGIERPLEKMKFAGLGVTNFFDVDDDILFNWNAAKNETIMEGRFKQDRVEFAIKYLAERGYQYRGNLKCPLYGNHPVRIQFVNYETHKAMLLDVDEETICLKTANNILSNFLVEVPIPELDVFNAGNPDWLVELLQNYCVIREVNAIIHIVTNSANLYPDSSESEKLQYWENMHAILHEEDYRYDEEAEVYISSTGYSIIKLYYDPEITDTIPTAAFYDSFGNATPVNYALCRF